MAKYSAFAASADARYAHISPEQKAEVAAACASAQEWMEERRGEAGPRQQTARRANC